MINTIILYFLTSVTLYFAFTNLIPCRFTLRQSAICLLLPLLCLCISFTGLVRIGSFCIPLTITGYLCFICRRQLEPLLTMSCSLSGYICYILSDNILAQLILWFFHIPVPDIPNMYIIPFCITSLIITYVVTYFPGRELKRIFFHKSCRNSSVVSWPASLILSALICLSILLLTFQLLSGRQDKAFLETLALTSLVILCLLAILTLFLLMIYFIHKDACTQSILQEYQSLQLYTNELESLNLRFRAFRHDYIDIMSTLSGYIENNDMEGLRHTFEHNIAPLGYDISSSIDRLSCLSHLKIPELKSIISLKLLDAHSHDIRVFLDIEDDIASVPMDVTDLARILGIFFNNAIDELILPDIINKVLEFGMIRKESSILLILRNTTLADQSILSSIESLGYSSKGKERGIGLYTVSTILARYSNAILSTSIEASVFIQALELYC